MLCHWAISTLIHIRKSLWPRNRRKVHNLSCSQTRSDEHIKPTSQSLPRIAECGMTLGPQTWYSWITFNRHGRAQNLAAAVCAHRIQIFGSRFSVTTMDSCHKWIPKIESERCHLEYRFGPYISLLIASQKEK